jgi:hypothetical protein
MLLGKPYSCTGSPCYTLRSLQPETIPILQDRDGYVAGMRVEKDGYRAVYLDMPLSKLASEAQVYGLIDRCVQWLRTSEREGQPKRFVLHPNIPNPFNRSTRIYYDVPVDASVRLCLYSISGQKIRTLVSGPHAVGSHMALWDGTDEDGRLVGSGVYVYHLAAKGFESTRKMVLIR